jgi:FKBP-type peptidyl-prolyl cis-trans isomerase FkpA
VLLAACGGGDADTTTGGDSEDVQFEADPEGGCSTEEVETESGLKYRDEECGDGETAEAGSMISVHYVGTLENGEKFDASRDRGTPFQFELGAGSVIAGWDEGVQGMQVGGIRILTIPPDLAYGQAGAPPAIPANATLIFEVELLEILQP